MLIGNKSIFFCFNLRFNCLFPLTEYPVKPGISLKTRWKDAAVYRGHRFAIVCGINSDYKVASMRLTTGVYTQNSTVYAKSPVEGEAVFMFPAAQDVHEGIYHCDYNFDFSPDIFSAPSRIRVTVKGKSLVIWNNSKLMYVCTLIVPRIVRNHP